MVAINVLGRTSIIIRRDAIEAKFPGGWDAFFGEFEFPICCGEVIFDDYLVAIHRRWVGLEAAEEFAPSGLDLWSCNDDKFRSLEWRDGCLVSGNGTFEPEIWPKPCAWLSVMADQHAVRFEGDKAGVVRTREDCIHMDPAEWMRTH